MVAPALVTFKITLFPGLVFPIGGRLSERKAQDAAGLQLELLLLRELCLLLSRILGMLEASGVIFFLRTFNYFSARTPSKVFRVAFVMAITPGDL